MITTLPFVGLLNNAALLLVLGVIYGTLQWQSDSLLWRIVRGVMLGIIAIGVMLNPWQLAPGMIFDTRTIVLSVGGMFLGVVPTAIATIMAGLFRLHLGGVGAFTGLLWIGVSGVSGLVWLRIRGGKAYQLPARDLFILGFLLHCILLLLMFTMPNDLALPILKNITLPILIIYPIVTVLLARLIAAQEVQKQNTIALNQSERKYRELIQNSKVVVLRADTKGRVTFINDYGQKFFGFRQDEIVGKPLLGTIVPKTDEGGRDLETMVSSIFGSPEQYLENENENVCRDGRKVQVLWKNVPIRNDAGDIVGIQSIGHDMTELRRTELFLRNKEEQLQRLMDVTPIPLIIIDQNQAVIHFNRMFTDLFGYTIEDVPSIDQWWSLAYPDVVYRERVQKSWIEAVDKAIDNGGDFEPQETRVHCKDGSDREVVGLYASIGDQAIVVLNDMTHERELDRMKSEFIATAAHELRTPLTAVRGFVELLLMEKEFEESERAEFLRIIFEKTEVLEKIIDDLLSLGRVESGMLIHLEKEACDIKALVTSMVNGYRHQYPDRTFTLSWDGVDAEEILAEPSKVVQVLDNILSNAIKFSPPDSSISIAGSSYTDNIEIAVSDKGRGMNAEQLSRVFDKFYRVDNSNTSAQGLGLGMGIAKAIVEAHGGEVRVESEPEKGCVVVFTLKKGLNSEER